MLKNSTAGAISAKAKTMFRARLTAQDYAQMAAKRQVIDVINYLKNETSYADALKNVQETAVHRHQLEFLLNKNIYRVYERLRHYAPGSDLGFYDYPKSEAEIKMLVAAVDYVISPAHMNHAFAFPTYLEHFTTFDPAALSKVRTYADVLEAVKRTKYHGILQRFAPADGGRVDIAGLEFALRQDYYLTLFESIDKLEGGVKKDIKEYFCLRVELINLSNIYRMKRFYHMSPARIANFIFPYYGKLRKKQINEIVEASDTDAFWRLLSETVYSDAFPQDNRDFIEQSVFRLVFSESRRNFRFRHEPPMVFTTYLSLLEIETDNIIKIIEGASFGLESAEIMRTLIM